LAELKAIGGALYYREQRLVRELVVLRGGVRRSAGSKLMDNLREVT
jgi:hypothetical protein